VSENSPEQRNKFGMLVWLWITVVVVAADLYTKFLAEKHLEFGQLVEVLPVLGWRLAYNTGAAFSFMSDHSWVFVIIASLVSLALIFWIYKMPKNETWNAIAMSMILGGALGNLYDRVTLGKVVDFIDVDWPGVYESFAIFNVADIGVCVGAGMIIIDALFLQRKREANKAIETEAE
jgi:signal peptidase II